jgi:uncharacterized protein
VYSRRGAPAELLRRWRAGEFELVASPMLLEELAVAFGHARVRARVSEEEAASVIAQLRATAMVIPDADPVGVRSRDAGDDYLLGLAQSTSAILVTGDKDLLGLTRPPIESPAAFLRRLGGPGAP